MTLFSYWTLFALASCVFISASAGPRVRPLPDLLTFAGGYVAAALLSLAGWSVEPSAVAALCAAFAGTQLVWAGLQAGAFAAAGVVSALSAAFLKDSGAPVAVAWTMSLLLPGLTVVLRARVVDFAPDRIREEALLFVLASGLLAAAAPEVLAGWESAMALNGSALPSSGEVVPGWVLIGLGLAVVAGAASRWWRRS